MDNRPVNTRESERHALLFALVAVALWSTVATGFKLGLRELAPVQLLLMGCLVALAFFAAARPFVRAGLTPRQHLAAAGLGLLNPLAYYLVLFEAYDRLPAQIAQPLNFTWAIALALLAVPLLRQRLSARGWLGIGVGYAGVVVLLTQGEFDGFGRFAPLGTALALSSSVIWAMYWLLTVRLGIHPVPLMLNGFAVATVAVGAICWMTTGLPALNLRVVGYGAWVGLVETGVTFLLWHRALALTGNAGRIGQLIFLSPFLSLILIANVLGEDIHPSAVVALAMIVGGLALSRR
ncbi:MAG: DMT family transporter [Gammaproteobacteria bacterium]|nr:DMT family transporter [Gammaproteobacteria bacterium]